MSLNDVFIRFRFQIKRDIDFFAQATNKECYHLSYSMYPFQNNKLLYYAVIAIPQNVYGHIKNQLSTHLSHPRTEAIQKNTRTI